MTSEQMYTYYSALAVRTGSNAITRIMDGNVDEAYELARNAASFAFLACPTLR